MATGRGSMPLGEVSSVCNKLETSPSKSQASSRIYSGGKGKGGKKSSKGSKMEKPRDDMPGRY